MQITAGFQLLWAILKADDNKLFSSLRRGLFSNRREGTSPSETDLFDFIVTHKNEYRKLPSPGSVKQNKLPYEPTEESVQYYYLRVTHRLIRSKTIEHVSRLDTILKENKGYENINSLVNEYHSAINEIKVSHKFKTLVEIAESYLVDLEQAANGVVKKIIPFGWDTLDKVTSGGMYGGDVIYAAARPRIR